MSKKKFIDMPKAEQFEVVLADVRDSLSRINIYFLKEDRSHPMYKKCWGDPVMMSVVSLALRDVVKCLGIDPKAKSY